MADFVDFSSMSPDDPGLLAFSQVLQEFTASRQLPGATPAQTTVISGGSLSPTRAFTVADTANGTGVDVIEIVRIDNTHDGMEIALLAAEGKTITLRHLPNAQYGVRLRNAADLVLSSSRYVLLKRNGTSWGEIVTSSIGIDTATNTVAGISRPDGTTITANNGVLTAAVGPNELASAFPPGGIIMWSGVIASIPTGWALCNGENGTPDLRDRFVVGAGSSYSVGATGGNATTSHTHTSSGTVGGTELSVSQMPGHTHLEYMANAYISSYGDNAGSAALGNSTGVTPATFYGGSGVTSNAFLARGISTSSATSSVGYIYTGSTGGGATHTHTFSGSATGSATTSIIPPYFALAYIMKL